MITIETQKGILDLFRDTTIELSIDNPFLESEKIPKPYTLDISIPSTVRNLSIFGNPERISSPKMQKTIAAQVLINGIPLMNGSVKFSEYKSGTVTIYFEGGFTDINPDQSLHEAPLGNFDVDFSSLQKSMNELLLSSIGGEKGFVAAPIRNNSEPWNNLSITSEKVNDIYVTKYVNCYNPVSQNYSLPGSKMSYVSVMIYVDKIFEQTLGMNPLNLPVVVMSSWKKYYTDTNPGGNKLNLNEAMPDDMSVGAFICEICKLFGITVYVNCTSFAWRANNDILADKSCVDWTSKLSREYTVTLDPSKKYSYGFKTTTKEKWGDYNEGNVFIKVDNISQMIQSSATRPRTYVITNTNEVFDKKNEEDGTISYKLIDDNCCIEERNAGGETVDVSTSIRPVKMGLHEYFSGSGVYSKRDWWYVPEAEFSSEDRTLSIGIYNGRVASINGDYYPYVSTHGYDIVGVKHAPISFDKKYLSTLHSMATEWYGKDKTIISSNALLDIYDFKKFDITKKISIAGVRFFIKTLTARINNNSDKLYCDIEFIEA